MLIFNSLHPHCLASANKSPIKNATNVICFLALHTVLNMQCSFTAFSEAGYASLLRIIEWHRNCITAAMRKFDRDNVIFPPFPLHPDSYHSSLVVQKLLCALVRPQILYIIRSTLFCFRH